MNLTDFFDKVDAHPELEGIGIDGADGKAAVIVRHRSTRLTTRIPAKAVEKADWAAIEAVLLGQREPVVLQHMTRVVGYYSRIENWNKSKIGELRDRHKGDYAILAEAMAE